MNKFIAIAFVANILSIFTLQGAVAQGTIEALDVKNGFRDAKLGMPLSDFKGMSIAPESQKSFNSDYIFYVRPSDNKRIGDIELIEIKYTFYKGKLYAVNYSVRSGAANLLEALVSVYGPAKRYVPTNKFEAEFYQDDKGYIWKSAKVKMICWIGSFISDNQASTASVAIESTVLESQIKKSSIKKRAADL